MMTLGKFMLATTKDQAHRIDLRDGIYAEVTLRFQAGAPSSPGRGLTPTIASRTSVASLARCGIIIGPAAGGQRDRSLTLS